MRTDLPKQSHLKSQARLGDNEHCGVASGPCAMFPSESVLRFSTLRRRHLSTRRLSITGCPTIHSLSPAGTTLSITRHETAPVFSVSLTICQGLYLISRPRTPFLPRGQRPERPERSPPPFRVTLIGHGICGEVYLLVCESDVYVYDKATSASVLDQDLRVASIRAESADLTHERREVGIPTNRR